MFFKLCLFIIYVVFFRSITKATHSCIQQQYINKMLKTALSILLTNFGSAIQILMVDGMSVIKSVSQTASFFFYIY